MVVLNAIWHRGLGRNSMPDVAANLWWRPKCSTPAELVRFSDELGVAAQHRATGLYEYVGMEQDHDR